MECYCNEKSFTRGEYDEVSNAIRKLKFDYKHLVSSHSLGTTLMIDLLRKRAIKVIKYFFHRQREERFYLKRLAKRCAATIGPIVFCQKLIKKARKLKAKRLKALKRMSSHGTS